MKKRSRSSLLLLLLLMLLLSVASGIKQVNAKYARTYTHARTLTIKTSLAKEVILQEVIQEANYPWTTKSETTNQNTYYLIPGVDIEKAPYIQIIDKTPVRAYLYIEIVDNTVDTYEENGNTIPLISYTVTSEWKQTTAKTPEHGGTVYVYTGGPDNDALVLTNENTPNTKIYILQDNKVTVSQHIKSFDNTSSGDKDLLEFYVYLVETTNQ